MQMKAIGKEIELKEECQKCNIELVETLDKDWLKCPICDIESCQREEENDDN